MMSQAVSLPVQSAILSIVWIVALTAGATSSGASSGGTEVATRLPPPFSSLESSAQEQA
jgi:hypothetical protein